MNKQKKYLSVSVPVGTMVQMCWKAMLEKNENVNFALFKNEDHEENKKAPHYKNSKLNASLWINIAKAKEVVEEEVVGEDEL